MILQLTPDEVGRIYDDLDRGGEARYALDPVVQYRFLYTNGPSRLSYTQTFSGGTYTLSVHPEAIVGAHGGQGPVALTIQGSQHDGN